MTNSSEVKMVMNARKKHILNIMTSVLLAGAILIGNIPLNSKVIAATNGPDYPKIKIVKTSSEDSNVRVKGATYGLYTDAECKTVPIETGMTDAQGVVIFNEEIESGEKFYVKEITPAPGYKLSDTIYPIIASASSSIEIDGSTATSSEAYDDNHGPEKAFDGITDSYFDGIHYLATGGNNGVPAPSLPIQTAWVMVELPDEYNIDKVSIYPRADSVNRGARMVELQVQIATVPGDPNVSTIIPGDPDNNIPDTWVSAGADWETILVIGDLMTEDDFKATGIKWYDYTRDQLTMSNGKQAKYIRIIGKQNMHCNLGEFAVTGYTIKSSESNSSPDSTYSTNGGYLTLNVIGEPIISKLTVHVKEEVSGNPVPGAKVDVTDKNGVTTTYTTNNDGNIVDNEGNTPTVPAGDYDIKVYNIPDGYTFTSGETETVTVPDSGTGSHEAIIKTTLGGIVHTIYDESTGGVVKGCDVEVTAPDGTKDTYTTDDNGQITVYAGKDSYGNYTSDPGSYTYKVVKIPDGYKVTENENQTATVVAGSLTSIESKIALIPAPEGPTPTEEPTPTDEPTPTENPTTTVTPSTVVTPTPTSTPTTTASTTDSSSVTSTGESGNNTDIYALFCILVAVAFMTVSRIRRKLNNL